MSSAASCFTGNIIAHHYNAYTIHYAAQQCTERRYILCRDYSVSGIILARTCSLSAISVIAVCDSCTTIAVCDSCTTIAECDSCTTIAGS
jgi:hypothetical protein